MFSYSSFFRWIFTLQLCRLLKFYCSVHFCKLIVFFCEHSWVGQPTMATQIRSAASSASPVPGNQIHPYIQVYIYTIRYSHENEDLQGRAIYISYIHMYAACCKGLLERSINILFREFILLIYFLVLLLLFILKLFLNFYKHIAFMLRLIHD